MYNPSKSKILNSKPKAIFCSCTARFALELVESPEDNDLMMGLKLGLFSFPQTTHEPHNETSNITIYIHVHELSTQGRLIRLCE